MKIGHIHLKVRSLERAEDFYLNLLGGVRKERVGSHYSFLSMGDAHHEIALQEIGEAGVTPTPNSVGLYHSAFEVSDAREFLRAIKRLEEQRIDHTLVDHGISWAAYTADPDGNGVEVYLDRRTAEFGRQLWGGISRALSKREIERSLA